MRIQSGALPPLSALSTPDRSNKAPEDARGEKKHSLQLLAAHFGWADLSPEICIGQGPTLASNIKREKIPNFG